MKTLRIGSVPYLNAKPQVDWFHSPECDADVEVTYAVPSALAQMLADDRLDVANVSSFEALQNPHLQIVPGISISAYGAVKSVRLFSRVPLDGIASVALDTSSLTSAALTRILLKELFDISPRYVHHPPDLAAMLAENDAALIIGDLKLFDLLPGTTVFDLGQGWLDLTGLPFVYACWLAREDRVTPELVLTLERARAWGLDRLEELAVTWSERMGLPLDRCRDYLTQVMNYDLTAEQIEGLRLFQTKCQQHGLIRDLLPLRFIQRHVGAATV
jgi:chorismate dehydratase